MSSRAAKKRKPHPGSPTARKLGCECPVMDNCNGKGVGCDGAKYGWWINGLCTVHGNPEAATPQ